MLGGEIAVESLPGRGSSFTLSVGTGPLDGVAMLERFQDSDAPPAPAEEAPARIVGRILLAEDGADNQRLLSTHLRKAGAAVTLVDNGRAAVEAALASPFDLVFMDMQMPELDGYAATAALRRAGYRGPIVALTAHAMSTDRDKCLAAGCTDYLTKPVRRCNLLAAAERHLPAAGPGPGGRLHSELAYDPDMAELVRAFVDDLAQRMQALAEAGRRADAAGVQALAHQLRGAAGGFGFPGITDAAAVLEQVAGGGAGAEALQSHVDALVALCARVTAAPPRAA
jgi:CheY-like chemotaxis protein/HPt (histidine-containing phosphotransfer) domain-containing protein